MEHLRVIEVERGGSASCEHEPGNGTRYWGVACVMQAGPLKGQWLVSFPDFGVAYCFHDGANLAVEYVAEKLGYMRGRKLGLIDVSEMTKVVAALVNGSVIHTYTDDTGHLLDEEQ